MFDIADAAAIQYLASRVDDIDDSDESASEAAEDDGNEDDSDDEDVDEDLHKMVKLTTFLSHHHTIMNAYAQI